MSNKKSELENEHLGIYRRLQEHLDKLPIGYPATKSGVELRILKQLFTPEEVEIALKMKFIPETLDKIYKRVKKMEITIEELEKILERMYRKGSINHGKIPNQDGLLTKYYALAFLAVGMYEYQLKRLTKEFVQDFEEYLQEGFIKEVTKTKVTQLRTIPIEQSVIPEHSIAIYDDIRKIIENDSITQGFIAVMDCVCRKSKEMIGENCKKTHLNETCFTLGLGAKMSLDKGWSRRLTKEEALELLTQFEKEGLVIQPDNSQNPTFICNCCGDCCVLLSNLKKFERPVEYCATNYYAEVNSELCSNCGTCSERCQMEAIRQIEDNSFINKDRCIGCGLCVSSCPEGAIKLIKKENEVIPPIDRADLYKNIMDKKAELARQEKS
jgi:ferredoxin